MPDAERAPASHCQPRHRAVSPERVTLWVLAFLEISPSQQPPTSPSTQHPAPSPRWHPEALTLTSEPTLVRCLQWAQLGQVRAEPHRKFKELPTARRRQKSRNSSLESPLPLLAHLWRRGALCLCGAGVVTVGQL